MREGRGQGTSEALHSLPLAPGLGIRACIERLKSSWLLRGLGLLDSLKNRQGPQKALLYVALAIDTYHIKN